MEKKRGFSKEYWDKNYSELDVMDGIFNAKSHAAYVKGYFDIEEIEINGLIDFGFGLGHLFREFLRTFKPNRALGIEPSHFAFLKGQKLLKSFKVSLRNEDIIAWSLKKEKRVFDLGICTSVFQYLTDDEIKQVLPHISQRVKYLYFSVPTDKEQERLKKELDFVDPYAITRTKENYLNLLNPFFTIVSSRILESKSHFNLENTLLTDLLFRF